MTPGKLAMVAVNIEPTSSATFTLDQIFPTNETTTAGGTLADSDQLRTWDQENQKYRFFFRFWKTVGAANKAKCGHWTEDLLKTRDGVPEDYPLANIALKAGDAVFYTAKANDQTLTIPGQVPNEASGVLKQGYNMVGVGFPAMWNPNDAGTNFWMNANFTCGGTAADADQIRYWDEENQKFRFFFLFYKTVGAANKAKCYKWVEDLLKARDGVPEDYPVLTESLNVGDGFFYIKKKEGEIEFKPGLKL